MGFPTYQCAQKSLGSNLADSEKLISNFRNWQFLAEIPMKNRQNGEKRPHGVMTGNKKLMSNLTPILAYCKNKFKSLFQVIPEFILNLKCFSQL